MTDRFPLLNLQDTLDTLGGSAYFSTLDMKSGYWQVTMAPEDQTKTAFITHEGLYEWEVAPFGLNTMPGIFQN